MAVIENIVTQEGDILVIRPETPIVGLIALSQFVDTTTGETPTDYFSKQFRYSVDGGTTFSDWVELTLINIEAVSITKYNTFVIEYKYVRVGNVPEVQLSFEDILVSGTLDSLPYPVYDETPFKHFFEVTDINVFGWALNVLEKLYKKGLILPDYIQRADNNDNLEDEDFITYWNSITHFFALIVYFARQFENFESNELLLIEFLKNKDLAYTNSIEMQDLLYLYANHIEEYEKKGTNRIIEPKIDSVHVDGELLRLIDYDLMDEFIFCLFQNTDNGWCVGKSSPTWKGTEQIVNINKGYEFTKDVVDLAKYPLSGSSYITIDSGYMKLGTTTVPMATDCGVDDNNVAGFRIPIDPDEDYEISFRVKQHVLNPIISFGVQAFDVSGNAIQLLNFNTSANANYFFESQTMLVEDIEYLVRGVIWNKNKAQDFTSRPNIGVGDSLKNVSTARSIVPIVKISDASATITTPVWIRDLKIKPLKLNFSRGQLGLHSLIYMLFKNNNGQLTEDQIREYAENKLVPYNCYVQTKSI